MEYTQTCRRGRFVVLEGLSGVGKSRVAPVLAERLHAEFLPTIIEEFKEARRYVDRAESAWARFYTYLAANYALCPRIEASLSLGHNVVVESFFYRCLATHAAMGVTHMPEVQWEGAVKPDLIAFLTAEESVRKERLLKRDGNLGGSKWHRLVEDNLSAAIRVYQAFQLPTVDTTHLSPNEVADAIVELLQQQGGT